MPLYIIEIFNVLQFACTWLSEDITSEIFQPRENTHYHLRNTLHFIAHRIHSVCNESESLLYLEPKIWELIPPQTKVIESFARFNGKLKKCKPNNLPCRFCKGFIRNVVFIQNQSILDSQLIKICLTLVAENVSERCGLSFSELAVETLE